ncbi:hypothetical protein BGW38_000860 [Lunasporangiospora selenospora]|uniref:Amino acid transporter transmembrane domain-containing protein n=1 Tax=Lunasporangiospora selenospora TaxID=979761 RepID=A0A9P6FWG1_9FUNG|nr:hypothetical protein BGW38_000860 [Lunasporangiospora selenospora]
MPPREEIRLVHLTPQFLTTLPIFVFAFTCHQNIFSVYNELTDNGQSMLNRIISTSIGSAAVVYHIIGVLGYLTFGNIVGSNIILMYNTGLLVTIGRIAMVILVMFSFPLQCHPCRACLDKVLNSIVSFWNSTRFGNNGKYDNLSTITEVDDDGQHEAEPEHHDDHGAGPAQSNFKYIVMTLCILIGSYLIAITVSTLELVLSLVGSTGSTAISFILPGFFYYKLHINDRWDVRKVLSVCLIVYGFMVMTICLSANIRRIVNG